MNKNDFMKCNVINIEHHTYGNKTNECYRVFIFSRR